MEKKVLLGMSGGVDSSVSAVLLQNQGYDVIGVTMKLHNFENNENDVSVDAKKVCDFLGIPHYTIDFKDDFQKYVINDFICQYKNCRTPNPCIECNKYLKFGAMYQKALELGCNFIATGHYAKIEYSEKYASNVLKKSNAGKKDQSYVLYNITKELLNKVLFPLSDFENKSEIRKIANEYNLPVANKPDSEDICFIPDGDYKKFLEENSDIKAQQGNIVDAKGNILGRHEGLYRYTIGQRKGLGISNKVPLFVVGFDSQKNELIVGEEKELYTKEFFVDNYNLIFEDKFSDGMDVLIKTRYTANSFSGKIYKKEKKIKVVFDEPQKAITPGQSAVFYDGDIVIGGGKII